MNRARLLILLLFAAYWQLHAQNGLTSHPGWQIKPVLNKGFIMIHRASIGHLVRGYPELVELNISKPTLGNKLWHHENNFPDVGLSINVMDFKNKEVLGYAFTLAPYVEIPLNADNKRLTPHLRIVWGASYLTKKFDISQNSKNIAIGTHVNAFVQFRCFFVKFVGNNLSLEPGLTFTHYSNGNYNDPNLGLNVVSLSLGINFQGARAREISKSKVNDTLGLTKRKSNELLCLMSVGRNQHNVGDKIQTTRVLSLSYTKRVRNTHSFMAGSDLFYDDLYIDLLGKKNYPIVSTVDKFRAAIKLGYAYHIGDISLPIEIGYYAFQRYNADGPIVSRLGVRYTHKKGLTLMFGLRTHYAIAYNFELGIGYRLPF